MLVTAETRLINLICSYVASAMSTQEILSRIRNSKSAKTIFGMQSDKKIKYYYTVPGLIKFLKDNGKEDEALYIENLSDVEEAERQSKSDIRVARANADYYTSRHPFKSLFARKNKLEADALETIQLRRQAAQDALDQKKAFRTHSKEFTENNIRQFFIDVGFIQPKGMPSIEELFPASSAPEIEGESSLEVKGATVPSANSEEYIGIPDNVADNLYRTLDGAPTLFADFFMFNDPATLTFPRPYDKDRRDLNVSYQKKNFKNTHSFSDVHLEDVEQPAAEFPRHVGTRTVIEGGEIYPGEETE